MRFLKRILGVIGIILGAVGILVAIVQIVGIWFVNPSATRSLQDLSGGLQSGLDAANQALDRADGFVQDIRTELQVPPDQRADLSATLQTRVAAIDATLEGASSTVQTMQALFGTTQSVPLMGRIQAQRAVVDALVRAEQAMNAVDGTLDDLRQNTVALAQAGAQTVSEIDVEVEAVQSELAGLQAQLDAAQAALATVQTRLPWWIDWGSGALTLVFLWYGAAQWCLLFLAWRWVRQPD